MKQKPHKGTLVRKGDEDILKSYRTKLTDFKATRQPVWALMKYSFFWDNLKRNGALAPS